MAQGGVQEPIRVLVDALSAKTGGALSTMRALLPALDSQEGISLTIVATVPLSRDLPTLCPASAVIAKRPWPTARRLIWEQIALRSLSRDFDLVYLPGNFGLLFPTAPVVVGLQSLWHWGESGRHERARCEPRLRLRLAIEAILARATVRRAAAVVCMSDTLRDALTEEVGPLGSLVVTAPGPPVLPEGQRVAHGHAIAVGTDLPHKDWDGLVAAFEGDEALPPLLVVGPVGEKRRAELEKAGRGRVRLLGPVTDRRRLGDLVRGSSCLVAHSRLESLGFVPLEGFLSDVPVVYTDIPAHREFCGDLGWAYAHEDPAALGRAVKNALAAGPSKELPPVLHGSWGRTAAGLRDVFERVD